MITTKKTSFLIIVLLANFLITSCGCGKKKGDLLVREERRLKNNLKEQCKEAGWKGLEKFFEQDRTDFGKINHHIQQLLALQEQVNNLEKSLPAMIGKILSKTSSLQEKQLFQTLLDFISPLKLYPEEFANKKIDELLSQDSSTLPQKFSSLTNPMLIQLIKDFLANQLDLWRNLKQQLEQKSTAGNGDLN